MDIATEGEASNVDTNHDPLLLYCALFSSICFDSDYCGAHHHYDAAQDLELDGRTIP